MRLVTRLVASHTVVAAVLGGALALMLVALGRINSLVSEVRARELGSLQDEEALHDAAWSIEVAARHAIDACEVGASDAAVAAAIDATLARLRARLGRTDARAVRPIRAVVARYVAFAEHVVARDTCARLRSPEARRDRLQLDEDLTDAWIARLFELHGAISAKEEQARRTARGALASGALLGLVSLVVAALLARRMARGVTSPLAELSRAARRVGSGDFSPFPLARGPAEVEELSAELDRMRAALAELDSLKQGFVASVSHELRTPLTKLREALALLGDGAAGPLNERQTSVVAIARSACETEIRIVTTLLDLSRLRSGRPLKLESGQSLDATLRDAVTRERMDARARGVEIELDVSGPGPTAVLDRPLLEHAIANLIRNAVSVSEAGQVVRVARRLCDHGPDGRPGAWARVSVSDDGPGVSPEVRATLFEAFVTHPVRERPQRVGVGLGLTLAREVTRAHGGDVVLDETTTKGATFVAWIPLEKWTER